MFGVKRFVSSAAGSLTLTRKNSSRGLAVRRNCNGALPRSIELVFHAAADIEDQADGNGNISAGKGQRLPVQLHLRRL